MLAVEVNQAQDSQGTYHVARNFGGSLVLRIGEFLCFAAINLTDWFFLLGIGFVIFRKYAVPSIDNIFVFIKYVKKKYIFSNNTAVCIPHIHVCKTSISLYTVLILNERNKL